MPVMAHAHIDHQRSNERFIIVTGGPGSGKTSLIDALSAAGYAHTTEAGRAILQDQQAIDGPALPHKSAELFAEMMLCWELRSYREVEQSRGPVFFDRGVPDVIGYLRLMQLPVPRHVDRAARVFRYHPRVFIAPPWREIFVQDAERKQDFDEAVRTYQSLERTYREYGYELVELPCDSVDARVKFVLGSIAAAQSPDETERARR